MTDPRSDYLTARRESIREAAERVFVARGFDGATMQEIADEASISAGSIYRYFDSKDDLIRAVSQACGARSAAQFAAVNAPDASPLAVLLAAGERIWDEIGVDGSRADTVLNLEATLAAAREPAVATTLAESLGAMRVLLEGLIREAQARGELDASVDPPALAVLLIAATGGMQTLALQAGDTVDVRAVWRVLDQLLAGIRPGEDEG